MPVNSLYEWTKRLRNRHFIIIDVVVLILAPMLAFLLRYDGDSNLDHYIRPLFYVTLVFLSVKFTVFVLMGLYERLWHNASIDELARLILIGTAAVFSQLAVFGVLRNMPFFGFSLFSYSFPFIESILAMMIISASRFSIRFFERAKQRVRKNYGFERVLIVGAGQAGINILQELQRNNQLHMDPVAFVDDDKSKVSLKLRSIPVLGTRKDIPAIINRLSISKIIIAIPSVHGKEIREILKICESTKAEVLTIPGLFELLDGRMRIEKLRKIQIDDLLRRDPIKTDIQKIFDSLTGRTVLVTGAGGSIGSEICRQVLRANPKKIILLGHGENSVFEIDEELKYLRTTLEDTHIIPVICDIRMEDRLERVFKEHRPNVVFHAAAHKHVPLMEMHPEEAITNNVYGTYNCVNLAVKYHNSKFIMISTDKAVNPTNVMGASKRISEMIVLDAARKHKGAFSVVRFGNVLGSRGSVIHTFTKQIQRGGPVTVTHPNILRYFMTIPEAVQLVLQAFILGRGGEIFVLDMGEPHLVANLAKDMISLSGLEIGKDIEIKYTGLRPGEKLFEELFIEGEQYDNTNHNKILIARNASSMILNELQDVLPKLFETATYKGDESIIDLIKKIVIEYRNGGIDKTTAEKLFLVKAE